MNLLLKITLVASVASISASSFAQTVDKDKLALKQKNCEKEYQAISSSPDSKALFDALLEVSSSKECGGKLEQLKVIQTTLSRGMSKEPGTECIIKLKSLTGDIGFSDVGAGEIQIVGTEHKLAWDNLHLKTVSKQDHLNSLQKQLKVKGICDFKVADFDPAQECKDYQIKVTSTKPKVGEPNISMIGFEYYDAHFEKMCEVMVEDDDGMFTLSLLMLEVKNRAISSKDKKVTFTASESIEIKNAIKRQSEYLKSHGSLLTPTALLGFQGEEIALHQHFSDIKNDKSRSMDKDKFNEALKYIGTRTSEHVYARHNNCSNTNVSRKTDQLLFAPGQKREHDWDLSKGLNIGCYVTVSGFNDTEQVVGERNHSSGAIDR